VRSVHSEETGREGQHRNLILFRRRRFPEAEGSIRQQPLCEVVLESAVSLAQGMFPKRLAGNPRELPILSHT